LAPDAKDDPGVEKSSQPLSAELPNEFAAARFRDEGSDRAPRRRSPINNVSEASSSTTHKTVS